MKKIKKKKKKSQRWALQATVFLLHITDLLEAKPGSVDICRAANIQENSNHGPFSQ
jgi:hypothetical protein